MLDYDEAMHIADQAQDHPVRYQHNQIPGLRVSFKLVDQNRLTQLRVDVSAVSPSELFNKLDAMIAESTARGYIVDEWPFNPNHGLPAPSAEPQYTDDHIDQQEAYSLPAFQTQQEAIDFIRSDEFAFLPGKVQAQLLAFAATGEGNRAAAGEQPAYLAGLFDHNKQPLMALPPGVQLPADDRRPQAYCPIHRRWMWQRGEGSRKWFSHPVGEHFCKGKAQQAATG